MEKEPSDTVDCVPGPASSPGAASDPPVSESDGDAPGHRKKAWLGMVAVATALVLVAAVLAGGQQAVRASRSNPVDALRCE